jgi:hypothetical protein
MHLHAKLADVAPDGSTRILVREQAYLGNPDPDRAAEVSLGHTRYRLQPGTGSACTSLAVTTRFTSGTLVRQRIHGIRSGATGIEQTLVTGGSVPSQLSITVHEDA